MNVKNKLRLGLILLSIPLVLGIFYKLRSKEFRMVKFGCRKKCEQRYTCVYPKPEAKVQQAEVVISSQSRIDQEARFIGGEEALARYINTEVKYAPSLKGSGTVLVGFHIDHQGSVYDARIVRSVNKVADKEALQIIQNMPKWEPAYSGHEAVNSNEITLPIKFK